MYDPVKDGVDKSVRSVSYIEVEPPPRLADVVHCFWQMKTEVDLTEDFELHALPDACVNILFNQVDPDIAGVTALHTTHTTLNLGRSFHYVGIQLYPGVWRGDPGATVDHYVGEPYEGTLPLVRVGQRLATLELDDKVGVFAEFVDELLDVQLIAPNAVTSRILRSIGDIHSVADMAEVAALSTRQLQRTLRETTGFTPHDLLKVLRLQHAFRHDYLLAFADQAHYTHSFRKATGYTPARFRKKFDV